MPNEIPFELNFKDYQRLALTTAAYPRGIYYPALGLGAEAGETLNIIKKVMRDHNNFVTQQTRECLADELGDVLWYLAALCTELGLDLATVARVNLEKLDDRARRGVIQGSGDKR